MLHGDVHHANVLHFAEHGWLVIDPKGLIGERGFEFANLFCNPDYATATARGRLARQVEVVTAAAGLQPRRLLQWIVAYAGVSSVWLRELGMPPTGALRVAELAMAELEQ